MRGFTSITSSSAVDRAHERHIEGQDLLLNDRRAGRNAALAARICALHSAPFFSDAFLCNWSPEGHMWV